MTYVPNNPPLQVEESQPISEAYVGDTIADASSQGDGSTTYEFDMSGYRYFSIQISDTPGATGTNTYAVGGSLQDDGTAAPSCTYVDNTLEWFGSESFTTDALLERDTPAFLKYVQITVTRSGDGASTDGAWTIWVRRGY